MKRILITAATVITGVAVYFGITILMPRTYDARSPKPRHETEFLQLSSGSRIAYVRLNDSSASTGIPIVYLHGGPGAGITSREIDVYTELARLGHEIYLYDQVGCGQSSRLDDISDYTAERHLQDLKEIVDSIGARQVTLIGQSWGSILAVSFLAAHSAMVNKLIITAPAPLQPANPAIAQLRAPDSLRLRPPSFDVLQATERISSLRTRAIYYLARKHGIKLAADKEADAYATVFADQLNKAMVCDPANAVKAEGSEGLYVQYMTSLSLRKSSDQREKLRKLNTPVLVLKAQCDNQPWGYTAEYLDVFQNNRFRLVENAGHNIFIEQPGVYINAIHEFLSG